MAYAFTDSSKADLSTEPGIINIVKDWGREMSNTDKVPSVISYSAVSNDEYPEQQWGSDLSPDAVAMVNSKLELDVQDNKSDELDLILQALDGMSDLNFDNVKSAKGYPDYTWKAPEDIVTDYLTKVFEVVQSALAEKLGTEARTRYPVDIVLTVPVVFISLSSPLALKR